MCSLSGRHLDANLPRLVAVVLEHDRRGPPPARRLRVGAEVDLHCFSHHGVGAMVAFERRGPVLRHHVDDHEAPDGDLPVALPAPVLARALVEPGVRGGRVPAAAWGRGGSTPAGTNTAAQHPPAAAQNTQLCPARRAPPLPSPLHTAPNPPVDRLGDPGALERPAGLDSLRSNINDWAA